MIEEPRDVRHPPTDCDDGEGVEVVPQQLGEPIPGPENEEPVQEEEGEPDTEIQSEVETAPPRRSTRERKQVDRYSPSDQACDKSSNYLHECREAMRPRAVPKSYKMAMKSDDTKEWRAACDKEMKSIKEMGVWEIVDRPKDSPVVGGPWHFKLKLNPDGSVNKHKARYVAKGYTQTEGIDYN